MGLFFLGSFYLICLHLFIWALKFTAPYALLPEEPKSLGVLPGKRKFWKFLAQFMGHYILLQKQKHQVEESAQMAAIGKMAGGITHEINNPMSIISLNDEFILNSLKKKGVLDEDLEESLEAIQKTVDRVRDIISGFQIIMGQKDSHGEFISLRTAIDFTMSLVRDKFYSSNIEIKNQINPEWRVYTHPVHLSQVLLNLVQNSYDAISMTPHAWVAFHACCQKDHIELSVVDSGEGIDLQIAQKMMRPFYTTKKVGQGMGLGLSLCQKMLEASGGKLYYDKKQPNTCFKICLPRFPSSNPIPADEIL